MIVVKALKEKMLTLAVAESCTGGLISHRITNIPGSSACFSGGVVAYSNKVKTSLLKVSPEIITRHGAVSREVAMAMAMGIKCALKADIAAAITGIAGPGGGTVKKPVGLAYLAVATDKTCKTEKVQCKGSRLLIKEQFSDAVLKLIEKNIG